MSVEEKPEVNKLLLEYLLKISRPSELLNYKQFIEAALYHPTLGYYTKERERVGKSVATDFYTSTSFNPVFSKLIIGAVEELVKPHNLKEFTFVEIGAEPNQKLLSETDRVLFKNTIEIRCLNEIQIPKRSIVFSNELLDAQPFHRLVFKNGKWRERGVRVKETFLLKEELLPEVSGEVRKILDKLPKSIEENYEIDLPLNAESLIEKIVRQNWQGLLVFFDYGLFWEEIAKYRPQGTARAYYRHTQSNDLFANPGEQDITCHICWDRLFPILKKNKFSDFAVESQEAFFVRHAKKVIAEIVERKNGMQNKEVQQVKELLHPGLMGKKFQVLSARRF